MGDQQSPEETGPVVLRETVNYRFRSRHVNGEFEVRVARPIPGFRSPPVHAYPLLYVLDGDLFFGTAVEMTRLMHMLYGELPPLLVVGIGYGTNDPVIQGTTRNRDFTPSVDRHFEAMGRQMNPDAKLVLPEGEGTGGADRFLDFLEEEVKPFIADRYPVADDRGTLFGASMGGLLATYTLLSRPQMFGGYIIASPSLWWDGELLFRMEEPMDNRPEIAARAFLGVGSQEEGTGVPALDEFRLVTNTLRMAERLDRQGPSSRQVACRVFEGESHTSVVPAVLTRGLRSVHGGATRA